MSDLTGPEEPDDPTGHAELRALLSGFGAEEPVPADVAARLDEALAGLVAERGSPAVDDTGGRVVVPDVARLDRRTRLRRKWAPRVLVAATVALVVGGIGISIAQLPGSGSAGTASSQAGGSLHDKAGNAARPGTTAAEAAALPSLSSRHFHADARRLLASDKALRALDTYDATQQGTTTGRQPSAAGSADKSPSASASPTGLAGVLATCGHRPGLPTGAQAVPVQLDGQPATLVVSPTESGRVRVTAYSCGGGRALASASVPR